MMVLRKLREYGHRRIRYKEVEDALTLLYRALDDESQQLAQLYELSGIIAAEMEAAEAQLARGSGGGFGVGSMAMASMGLGGFGSKDPMASQGLGSWGSSGGGVVQSMGLNAWKNPGASQGLGGFRGGGYEEFILEEQTGQGLSSEFPAYYSSAPNQSMAFGKKGLGGAGTASQMGMGRMASDGRMGKMASERSPVMKLNSEAQRRLEDRKPSAQQHQIAVILFAISSLQDETLIWKQRVMAACSRDKDGSPVSRADGSVIPGEIKRRGEISFRDLMNFFNESVSVLEALHWKKSELMPKQ